uniref:Glyco_hydro_38C domain-containing protein n=1 Tax=Onchocerca flexuosa TaxID=387005 RepID=A0A183HM07_9BILA
LNNEKFAVRFNEGLKGFEADSWGTEFIFVLPSNSRNINRAACHIFGMNKQENITVNIEYSVSSSEIDNSVVGRKKDNIIFKGHYKFMRYSALPLEVEIKKKMIKLQYDFDNLVVDDTVKGLHMLANNQIHISSSNKISIIAYTIDEKSAADYFLVHPVGMGGDFYAFSLPGPSTVTLYFLPLGATNKTILQSHGVHNVLITARENDKLEIMNQTMQVW